MRKMTVLMTAAVLTAVMFLSGCGSRSAQSGEPAKEESEAEDKTEEMTADVQEEERGRAEEILAAMSVREKAAQILMPALRSWTGEGESGPVTELLH